MLEYLDQPGILAQRFEPKSLDKRNVTFIVNNYTEMQDAANALERQHSMGTTFSLPNRI